VYAYPPAPTINDGGPNQGYRYLTSFDTSSTAFWYVISPPLEDPGSQFYQCQTGISPIISVANLINGTNRHEGGSINSHFSVWSTEWTAPENNYGIVAEKIVTGNVSDSAFSSAVDDAMTIVSINIKDALDQLPEPCGVNMDDTCTTLMGAISFFVNGACTTQ
jgi:hypothetical protein